MPYITKECAKSIDELRKAAANCSAVYNLLLAIDRGILIDGAGNKEILAEGPDLELIEAAQLAAAFAQLDLNQST